MMRRYLDLNQPSAVFLKLIGLLVAIIPAVLYGFLRLCSGTGTIGTFLLSLMKSSFAAGVSVLIVFLILIAVEQVQDHYFDILYKKQLGKKILLVNGSYECQYCGNRRVQEKDKTCEVCGKEFALETPSKK